jgi:hypothetical protein
MESNEQADKQERSEEMSIKMKRVKGSWYLKRSEGWLFIGLSLEEAMANVRLLAI